MASRLELQSLLEGLLGSRNVYFQPPGTVEIKYPAIVYSVDSRPTDFANDNPYIIRRRYKIMVIDKNPDSATPDKVGALKSSKFNTSYVKDNLHHNVYNLYF
jgi:hypothetical protein